MNISRVSERLVVWMAERVEGAGARGIALGLSGGIDSAVVAGLAKKAVGENVVGLIMPCHSIEQDEIDARLLAEHFQIEVHRVDLAPAFDGLLGAFRAALGPDDSNTGLAEANIKPRLRMVTLYYEATRRGFLVAGTGNLSELTVGYFTKHGDSGVDLLPIGGLVKGEVRALAKHLGVPQPIIDKAPSAGLWQGQTDEQEMGFTYEQLDRYIRTGQTLGDVERRIAAMHARSTHKRQTPPIGPVD